MVNEFEIRQQTLTARQRNIDDQSSPITFFDNGCEFLYERFARMPATVHGGDVGSEQVPRGEDAQPIEAALLKIIEVFADKIFRRTQRCEITEPEQERRLTVDGEMFTS